MKSLYLKATLLFSIGLISVTGCGSGVKLIPVTGSVQVDDKPAEGAVVLFFPSSPEAPISSGACDADGKFKIVTDSVPGIPAGSYSVTVRWPAPAVKLSEAQRMSGQAPDPPDLLKGKYSLKDKSLLKADVDSATRELAPFQLTTK